MKIKSFAWVLSASLFLLSGTPCRAEAISTNHDNLTLDQAIRVALENHRSRHVSQATLEVAEAQYRQAMAAFRPRLGLEAGFQRADQDRTYTFEGTIQPPPIDVTSLVNPLLPPGSVTLPVTPISINMATKLFDRDLTQASLNLSYPLYTGGRKDAITGMAKAGVDIAREEQRKTDLDIVRDINRYYNGALLARRIEQLASDTLERFQVLEELTERLYQNASLKVRKTDYLRSKTTTAMTRTMLEEARYAQSLVKEALANSMGLPVNTALTLAPEPALPEFNGTLDTLINDAMNSNPDKQRLELALRAAQYKIEEARGGHLPVIGLEASVYRAWNDYKGGLINDDNRAGWTLGVGLKWDLIDGGLTHAAVDGARAGKMKLEAQRVLLDNGLALGIKDDFLRIRRSLAQVASNTQARDFAEENRKLNVRAYQEEMVETKDVIEAQIVESLASVSLYRSEHDLRAALADLDYRVGKALQPANP